MTPPFSVFRNRNQRQCHLFKESSSLFSFVSVAESNPSYSKLSKQWLVLFYSTTSVHLYRSHGFTASAYFIVTVSCYLNTGNGLSSSSACRGIWTRSPVSRNKQQSSTSVHDSAYPETGHVPRRTPLPSMHAVYHTRLQRGLLIYSTGQKFGIIMVFF